MAILPEQYQCDNCGRVKQQANHWFVLNPSEAGITVSQWPLTGKPARNRKFACGQSCSIAIVGKWMDEK